MENDLTLEKLKVVEQLQSISTSQAVMFKQLDQLSTDHRKLNETLLGDGSTGKVGLVIRLDRIEQNNIEDRENRSFHRKWIYGLIGGLGLEHFRHIFFGK